ncbi:unnamed protein product [Heligmosomoides polygyrus]|uniref:Uncharacterized protein n=1 Tax=Heligmosomoides polygyrus TaxID=6339 RepID=A0A3P7XQB0_HELPZ|nr:unnamed protein product [Heligmosomoides polygyrus]
MDYSVTITKRRSLPRILCSSKKNTWSSPIETNLIKQIDDTGSDQQALALLKQEIESSEDEDRRSTPEQRLSGGSPIPPSLPNSQPSSSSPLLTTAKETTSPALCRSEVVGSTDNADPGEERVDEQEIRVSPMITVRRGPQLVNLFAPPVDVEEKPPELEREGPPSPVHSSTVDHMDYTTDPTRDAAPVSVAACLNETLKQHLSNDTTPSRISYLTQLTNDAGNKPLSGARQNVALEGIVGSKDEQKYSSLTLGSVIGIRRPRVTNTQNSCGNLTLDQLNPTLAEALAAMKSKSDAVGKGNGYIGSHGGADGLCRRDSLPTRMSGPVKLESLSSTSQCASTPTGHLVSFNGQTTEVPEEIHCHLCDYPMKLCIRKSKYKGEIREYAAYRCLRKGCQTFRSVRKVIEPDYPCARKRKPEEVGKFTAFADPGRRGATP